MVFLALLFGQPQRVSYCQFSRNVEVQNVANRVHAEGCVTKPFDIENLVDAVNKVLFPVL